METIFTQPARERLTQKHDLILAKSFQKFGDLLLTNLKDQIKTEDVISLIDKDIQVEGLPENKRSVNSGFMREILGYKQSEDIQIIDEDDGVEEVKRQIQNQHIQQNSSQVEETKKQDQTLLEDEKSKMKQEIFQMALQNNDDSQKESQEDIKDLEDMLDDLLQAVSLLKNLSFTINKQHLKVTPKPLIQIVNLSQFNFNTEQQSKQEGQNSSYSDQQWFNSGTQSQENTQQPPINDQNQNPNDTTNPPPLYDFQAPKDDSYKNFQSTKDFIRRYLILFPLAAYQEVKLVRSALEKVVLSNGLEKFLNPNYGVKVIHEPTLGMFMSTDQTLFLSSQILKQGDMQEEQVALLLCHELSHYLLDHQVLRIMKSIIHNFFINTLSYKKIRERQDEFQDPVFEEYRNKTKIQQFMCFYDEQRIMTKFYEKTCDTLALQLWKKAYPDINHEEVIDKVYGRVSNYTNQKPKSKNSLNSSQNYDSLYQYNRQEVNLKLNAANIETKII
eukprot:403338818